MVTHAKPTIPRKETKLHGLPHGVTAAEEDALWGEDDGVYLRPKQHKEWLAHFISVEFALARLLAGWIPACGHLEWKLELPRLMFENMQAARRLRERLEEFPGGNGTIEPAPALAAFIGAIAPADHGASFVRGLLERVLPAVARGYAAYIERCDEVLDAPTLYLLRPVLAAKEHQIAWGRQFLSAHPLAVKDEAAAIVYRNHLEECLRLVPAFTPPAFAAATPFPKNPVAHPAGPNPQNHSNDPRMRLRVGFPMTKEGNPTKFTVREIVYHNATEWQVIDPMCNLFHGIPNMPMDFFVDFSRHTWDEARHARMGWRRLLELGFDPFQDFEWSHGTTRLEIFEDFFAGLTMVGEACSFTRKKGSIPFFLKSGDRRSAMLPEIDCVDEQLHVGYGHKWAAKIYELVANQKRTMDAINKDRRTVQLRHVMEGGPSDAKEFLAQLDETTRRELVNTFSGFCGAIEFKMDLTVY